VCFCTDDDDDLAVGDRQFVICLSFFIINRNARNTEVQQVDYVMLDMTRRDDPPKMGDNPYH